jgi:hypothetical protein
VMNLVSLQIHVKRVHLVLGFRGMGAACGQLLRFRFVCFDCLDGMSHIYSSGNEWLLTCVGRDDKNCW